jgi:dethiobiotin synthetase
MPSYFITGTDTGVGKTWFTGRLVRAWLAAGHRAAALKPISAGDRDDARLLREASGEILSLDETNPVHLREPAAPLLAARAENRVIDFAALNRHIASIGARFPHLAVEGVGGWRVPLAPGYEVRDWARDLALPVVVVALDRLGALNHILLTVESIRASDLTCVGVVLNPGPETNASPDFDLARGQRAALLREILLLPVLDFGRGAQASGEFPVWLGGKEI